MATAAVWKMLKRKKMAINLASILWIGMAGAGFSSEGMPVITDRDVFLDVMDDSELRYLVVRVKVQPDGTIKGRALRWDITGNWTWEDGYFCREMDWGGYSIDYNCQEVRAQGNRMRFTSDKGSGDTAVFRIR